jgi:hypothetical protein
MHNRAYIHKDDAWSSVRALNGSVMIAVSHALQNARIPRALASAFSVAKYTCVSSDKHSLLLCSGTSLHLVASI